MKTRLLSGVHVFCGETIVPEGLAGLQLSFNFTVRKLHWGAFLNDILLPQWKWRCSVNIPLLSCQCHFDLLSIRTRPIYFVRQLLLSES